MALPWLTRKRLPVRSSPPVGPELSSQSAGGAQVDAAFWILLARAPEDDERRERVRSLDSGQDADQLLRALIASAEFRLIYDSYLRQLDVGRKVDTVELGLRTIGGDDAFVEQVYRWVLGRPADAEGLAYYTARLADRAPRWNVVKGLIVSDEFDRRFRTLCPQIGILPRDIQLCELANPAKWENPEWLGLLASLKSVPVDKFAMHRKGYEFAQALFGLKRLNRLSPTARIVSVGAGHECLLYWLANEVGMVVATDLYDTSWGGAWAGEGDDRVIKRPEDYAPFPYRRDHLVFLKMDGRALAFPSNSFDIAYSLSSIEHFGGLEGAMTAVDEMARVLKPGGMLVLATEYILSGPPHHEAFFAGQVHALVDRPGLRLIEPIDERVHQRYEMAAVDIQLNPFQTPHMAVRDGDTVFTSVMMFLEKQVDG